jgi:hypothetical protein
MSRMSELHAAQPQDQGDEPQFTARDGKVFLQGIYRTEAECVRLLEVYRLTSDWFAPLAKTLAEELEAAMADAAWQLHQEEAA